MAKDFYETLGVDKEASDDDIKRAFRKQAHKYHPDKKDGDAEKFKEVNEAYQTLSDQQKRQQYDQFGQTFDGAQGPGGSGGFGGFDFNNFRQAGGGGAQDFGDIGDIFGDMFGGRQRRSSGPEAGADIEMRIKIDFMEAVQGTEKELKIYKRLKCDKCSGNGAEPGTKINTCQKCDGKGQVTTVRQTMLGAIQQVTTCPDCRGEGKKAEVPCKKCGGDGRVRDYDTFKVKIPAGIDSGQAIRIADRGEAGLRGGPEGDLFLQIEVKDHEEFSRDGYDLLSQQTISFSQAALGDKISVSGIYGEEELKIPAGTQTGVTFKIKNKGIPHLNTSREGDHIVQVIVETPRRLNKKQKKLLGENGL